MAVIPAKDGMHKYRNADGTVLQLLFLTGNCCGKYHGCSSSTDDCF